VFSQRFTAFFSVIYLYCAVLGVAGAQISPTAYRALGQPDLQQNGVNMVQGLEMNGPVAVALDARDGALHLYISDRRNNRVLAWRDAGSSQIGDPATLVLGQPSPQQTTPYGIGAKGFNAPTGMAVDPTTGNLYVADAGNSRVLRFPAPFANPTRVEPDAVYGQANFTSLTANPFGVTNNSLNAPGAVAFDSAGNLWVSDTGNHRILRFNAAVLNAPNPSADIVLGQRDFVSGNPNAGGTGVTAGVTAAGFNNPVGLAFDQQGSLYVADFFNTRVLKFTAPIGINQSAAAVFGEPNFTSRGVPPQPTAYSMQGPQGLCVDNAGNLYVATPLDNRILVFSTSAGAGPTAASVIGQVNFTNTTANPSAFPYASASTFASPADVKVDANGNLYVADAGNNRVVAFAQNAKSASQLWGQLDFSSNGINQIKAGSINAPFKMAIDYSQSPYALYVSDINNNRILVWKDATAFHTGDPADLVIGQPNLTTAIANADTPGAQKPSSTSLAAPRGIALDSAGNLWVADAGNNRVLRYPRPVDQSGRITPDTVIGQVDFASSVSAAVNASSLNTPSGLAIGPNGDIFVADSGNNRVLEFPAGAVAGTQAIRVFGQPSFTTGALPSLVSGQTLASPEGIAMNGYALYVADTAANRVLVFASTQSAAATGSAADIVIGQSQFGSAAAGGGSAGLKAPVDAGVDSAGNIYVSDSGNNRILIFPSLLFLPLAGATASSVVGQPDMTSTSPNWNSTNGLATSAGLYQPFGIFVDRQDTLYAGDTGNNRVVHFLKAAAILNAANPQVGVSLAPGAMATIYGIGLSSTNDNSAGTPLPNVLANRQVSINDSLQAPLSSVASGQISLQMPWGASIGTSRFAVRTADTAELVAGTTFSIAASAPALFSASGNGQGQGQILNQDGTHNSSSNPAARGSAIQIFGTGQGPVSPSVADGTAPSDTSVSTVAIPTSDGQTCLTQQSTVCVAIGTAFGDIQFSGLAPGMVGVWQITVKVPASIQPGTVNLRAVINGNLSNIVTVALK